MAETSGSGGNSTANSFNQAMERISGLEAPVALPDASDITSQSLGIDPNVDVGSDLTREMSPEEMKALAEAAILSRRQIYGPRYHLDERSIKEITQIARSRKPYEACGLLMPPCWDHGPEPCSRVMELQNQSLLLQAKDPTAAYVISGEAIKTAIQTWIATHQTFRANFEATDGPSSRPSELELKQHFSVWHSHPHGGVGPSRGDLLNTVPGFSYLVCSLRAHEGGSTVDFAWF